MIEEELRDKIQIAISKTETKYKSPYARTSDGKGLLHIDMVDTRKASVPNSLSPNGIKKLYLRNIGYNFIEPEELLEKAKKYIDNYSDILEKKYNNKIKTLKNE